MIFFGLPGGAPLFGFILGILFSIVRVPHEFPKRLKNPLLFTVTLSTFFTTVLVFSSPGIKGIVEREIIIFMGFLWGWVGDVVLEWAFREKK